jgi:hypothetical protein
MDDEDAVLLTDALATGYFGAQLGDIAEGDVVAVFGPARSACLRQSRLGSWVLDGSS